MITGGEEMKEFSMKDNIYIVFLLFALFFGAGNLIFPLL